MTDKKAVLKPKLNKLMLGGTGFAFFLLLLILLILGATDGSTPVYLSVHGGNVQVDTGRGWVTAENGMELRMKDKIKTGEDGEASVLLYESSIVSIDSNTEVMIKDLDKDGLLKQNSDTTWDKFSKLNGVESTELDTPVN